MSYFSIMDSTTDLTDWLHRRMYHTILSNWRWQYC